MQSWRLVDTQWEDRINPVSGRPYQAVRQIKDVDTGMEVFMVRYPAGTVTPLHAHPCGHGLLVISGELETQSGSFGPGDMVWYPEGSIGTHGASSQGPMTALLFTNKAFGIRYIEGTP